VVVIELWWSKCSSRRISVLLVGSEKYNRIYQQSNPFLDICSNSIGGMRNLFDNMGVSIWAKCKVNSRATIRAEHDNPGRIEKRASNKNFG